MSQEPIEISVKHLDRLYKRLQPEDCVDNRIDFNERIQVRLEMGMGMEITDPEELRRKFFQQLFNLPEGSMTLGKIEKSVNLSIPEGAECIDLLEDGEESPYEKWLKEVSRIKEEE